MKDKNNALLILITFMIFSLSGCGKGLSKTNSELNKNDKKQYLNIILSGEPKTLDQSKASGQNSSQVIFEVNEALTRVEQDSSGKDMVKPAGAERWEISSDQLKWTFYLRDNKWSDGKKVTAKDYEYGIKRTLDPKVKSQDAFLLYPIKGTNLSNGSGENTSLDNLGVKALNDKTLEITLKSPCAYFLELTSYKIMQPQRRDLIEKYGDKYGTEANTMAFSGPFLIKQWSHNNKIELVKNNDYWDSKSVKLQNITMKILNDPYSTLDNLTNYSIDIAEITSSLISNSVKKSGKLDTLLVSEPASNFEFFDQNKLLFSNVKVRRAFSLAIDREDVSKTLWKGIYTPAYGWIPPKLQIGEDDFREKVNAEPVNNLKNANPNPKTLLIEGLRELGLNPDPSKITVDYLQLGMDSKQKEISEFFQKMYHKNLGVNVKIDYVDYSTFEKRIANGEYQMASMVWYGDYNDPMTELNLWSAGMSIIPTGWSNKNYDLLIEKATSIGTNKDEERFKLLKEAEEILLSQDCVIAPTVYRNKQIYKHEYVKGVVFPLFGPTMELKYAYTQGREE